MKYLAVPFFILPAFLLFSCDAADGEVRNDEILTAEMSGTPPPESLPPQVRVTPARRGVFLQRILVSGVLRATRRVTLHSRIPGELIELPVREGALVKKGELIAAVDPAEYHFQLRQARIRLKDAENNKSDLLLAQGGKAGVDTSVSAEKLKLIELLSGYEQALLDLEQAEYRLARTRVTAPFDGLIAGLKIRMHQQIGLSDELCTIISPSDFEAEFKLLENEAVRIRPGVPVRIRIPALAGKEWPAEVSTVNPLVSEKGLVTVRAALKDPAPQLFEGMNLDIVMEQGLGNQLLIPKSAVVLRSGRTVVFTCAPEEKLARWHYVTIAHENDEQVAVSEGLEAGDLVIYEGNLNLDNDTKVQIMEEE